MSLTNTIEQKKLEQVNEPIIVSQFRSTVERLFQLNRIGLLDYNETLFLINAYIKLVEEAQGAKGRDHNNRSRY